MEMSFAELQRLPAAEASWALQSGCGILDAVNQTSAFALNVINSTQIPEKWLLLTYTPVSQSKRGTLAMLVIARNESYSH
jgi:hypothetical protein